MKTEWEQLLEALTRGYCDSWIHADFNSFRRLAKYHGVVARIEVPAFKSARLQSQVRALRNLSHLQSIAGLFSGMEIPFLGIKGLPLALRLFGDVAKRHVGDIDLWVPEGKVEDVHELLVTSGHIAKTGYAELSPHFRAKYREKKFHVGYTHSSTGISVEIHWRLGSTHELFPLTFEDAYSRHRVVSTGSIDIPTPDDADHLLFLYIHAARHLWERLFWLVDIVEYHKLPDAPTPSEILHRASELGIDRAVIASWDLAREFLEFDPETEIPHDPVATRIADWGRAHLVASQRGLDPGQALRSAMMLHRSPAHKFQILTENATAADDWHRIKIPDGLGFLYVLLRPFFWIQRRLTARAVEGTAD